MYSNHFALLFSALVVFQLQPFTLLLAQSLDYPTADLSSKWTNGPNVSHMITYSDGSVVKSILLRRSPAFYGPTFACGFYCSKQAPCTDFIFAIFIVYANSGGGITRITGGGDAQIVWSSNRSRPVKENATLQLTADGDFVLRDADGGLVWSTNTSRKGVAGMNLTVEGNLVLFDKSNSTVWQSFDYSTDTLLPGQKLVQGQKLTANTSMSNWTQGEVFLSATSNGIRAFVGSDPPQYYDGSESEGVKQGTQPSYVQYLNGSLNFYVNSSDSSKPDRNISLPVAKSQQYMRLEFDGHVRIYEWDNTEGWKRVFELFKVYLGECAFPTVCGSYSVCWKGQCSCPQDAGNAASYFKQANDRQPNLGCFPLTPLDCQASQQHQLLTLNDVSYFSSFYNQKETFYLPNVTTFDSCKEACLKNCSCKAAVFQYMGGNASDGRCSLPTQIFSLMNNQPDLSHYNSTTYLKVQEQSAISTTNSSLTSEAKKTSIATIAGSTIGAFVGVLIIIFVTVTLLKKKMQKGKEEEDDEDEDPFDQLPGMPKRFSYDELKVATNNFLKKLGQGGFGSVYEGTLADGSMIAVKQLDSVRQGKKEFLAEVMTIGSIHHVNLVKLVGFCARRSYRLLVYEYMSNGSLDKWIFHGKEQLDWQTRKKIIYQVAKGLAYLHDDCRPKIAHLDIKPQNILLDDSFDAKVSDFGLAKLIEKDESCVVTAMRGTVGYLAPEWLTSKITEKVDVYSFGVLVTEIVCERKNLDQSQPEENSHLLRLIKDKGQEGRLTDIVTEFCSKVQVDEKEATEMLKLAIWCLQTDTTRRPAMSAVVKVLEGVAKPDPDVDYDFLYPEIHKTLPEAYDSRASAPLLASILSGPR